MINKKTVWISLLILILATVSAGGVLAQDDQDQLSPREAQQARLAQALGITVEELQAAQQEAEIARITKSVGDGRISMERGNLMLAMIYIKDYLDRDQMLASALGVSLEALQEAREEGTLQELRDEVTPAELRQGLGDAFEEALQEALDEMMITEEQAEMLRDHLGDGFRYYRAAGHHGRMPHHGQRWHH